MLSFQIQPQEEFLLVQLTGLVTPESWQQALQELGQAIQGAHSDRLVIDLGGLVGWLGEPERRAVGALMAVHLARMKRVALVVEARKITGVVEEEARKGGLDLSLFPDHDDAVNWAVA